MSTNDKSVVGKGQQNKKNFKEKIVQIYSIFLKNVDASQGNPNFWDEMFLLKANPLCLEAELDKLTGEQLVDLMDMINLLFRKSVEAVLQDHPIRISNALLMISALTRGVMSKCSSSLGFDMINILIGFDNAENIMKSLLDRIGVIITSDSPFTIKSLAFSLLAIFVTGYDNISQNTMLEYFMINSIFESLVRIISDPNVRHHFGCLGVQLISLLVQYRKNESLNPYIVKLSILDDEVALTGLAQVISNSLSKYNSQYQQKVQEAETSGFFATLTNLVGNMFVGEETKTEAVKANDSLLLALYEAIHLNRNFITTLTHSHTTSQPSNSPPTDDLNPTLDPQDPNNADASQPAVADMDNTPTNLLVTFLEYCSIISQDIKDMARYNSTKLCLVIFTCISEDQFANSLMHDSNMTFRVTLHRIPMRHRRPTSIKKPPSRPLVCSLIDLMAEFIISHLMKNFPMELHMRCLGVIHRILCYQKKCRIRLNIQWRDLWSALINLLKFVLSNEAMLSRQYDIFHLCTRVLNIFNLFITYGDMFLSDPNSYDELYYEIVRTHQVFDNIYTLGLRYTSQEDCPYKDSLLRLQNSLVNVRAIICHFTPKLESWSNAQHVSSLTEKEVLDVVRNNYDSLTLKMQDCLDQYERYSEKPKDVTSFFTHMVRGIVKDMRKSAFESYSNCPKIAFDSSA